MYAGLGMDVRHSANELRKYPLHLHGIHAAVFREVVIQLVSRTVLQCQPYRALRNHDLIQSRNMRMHKLSMMMYLSWQVRVILARTLEDDLRPANELVRCEVDFAEGALAYEMADVVVAHGAQVRGAKLFEQRIVGCGKLCALDVAFGFGDVL